MISGIRSGHHGKRAPNDPAASERPSGVHVAERQVDADRHRLVWREPAREREADFVSVFPGRRILERESPEPV